MNDRALNYKYSVAKRMFENVGICQHFMQADDVIDKVRYIRNSLTCLSCRRPGILSRLLDPQVVSGFVAAMTSKSNNPNSEVVAIVTGGKMEVLGVVCITPVPQLARI